MSIWGSAKKCQNYKFLDIFLNILHKMKGNLGQDHVKRGLVSFQAKLEQFSLLSLEKRQFLVLTLLFYPSLPKIWLSHLSKNYIFKISDGRAIR